MSENHNLPVNVEDGHEVGTITYANEVIAIIAGMATNEIDGVVSTPGSGGIADLFTGRKPATRGVKVEVGTEEASVDLVVTVEYGKPIQKVCTEVQENVRKAIETMTGLHVVKVDVHVVGISFEKDTQELAEGYEKANENADIVAGAPEPTADIDSPPEGIDPDTLPRRNIDLNDAWTDDECEEESAKMTDEPEKADEGE